MLAVENGFSFPILIPAGALIAGLHQDRMSNESVFVEPHTTAGLSVNCVEKGRFSGGHQETPSGRAPVTILGAGRFYSTENRAWSFNPVQRQQAVWSRISDVQSADRYSKTDSLVEWLSLSDAWKQREPEVHGTQRPWHGYVLSVSGSPAMLEIASPTIDLKEFAMMSARAEAASRENLGRPSRHDDIWGIIEAVFHEVSIAAGSKLIGKNRCVVGKENLEVEVARFNEHVYISALNRSHPLLAKV